MQQPSCIQQPSHAQYEHGVADLFLLPRSATALHNCPPHLHAVCCILPRACNRLQSLTLDTKVVFTHTAALSSAAAVWFSTASLMMLPRAVDRLLSGVPTVSMLMFATNRVPFGMRLTGVGEGLGNGLGLGEMSFTAGDAT
jgi:hypothetical protein